jgi:plastocyanin
MSVASLRRPLAWALATVLAATAVLALETPSLGARRTVRGVGTVWQPAFRRVRVGTRIVWRSVSGTHTVTSYRKRSGRRGRRWRKDVVIPQGRSTSRRFTRPGLYRFRCRFHPGMVGRIRVVRP